MFRPLDSWLGTHACCTVCLLAYHVVGARGISPRSRDVSFRDTRGEDEDGGRREESSFSRRGSPRRGPSDGRLDGRARRSRGDRSVDAGAATARERAARRTQEEEEEEEEEEVVVVAKEMECAVWMYYRLTPPRQRRNELARYEGSKAPRQNNNRTQPSPPPPLPSLPSTTCVPGKSSHLSPSLSLPSHEDDLPVASPAPLVPRTAMKLTAIGDGAAEHAEQHRATIITCSL